MRRETVHIEIEELRSQCKLLIPTQPEVLDGKPTDQDCFNQVVANTLFQILSTLERIEESVFE